MLPDGGHVSRSPEAGLELLLDLLSLDDAFGHRGLEVPAEASRAIDRLTRNATAISHQVAVFLEKHGNGLVTLLRETAPTYRAFVGGIGPFTEILQRAPGVLRNGATAIKDGAIRMAALFGTPQHPPTYSSADCPRYGSLEGRNCR